MTTVNEIIKNMKTVLRKHFGIVKAEIKKICDDEFAIHLPLPDKVKSFPYHVGMDGNNVFVPVSFGPDGIDMTIELPSFEKEYGLVSDYRAACLAAKGLMTRHEEELSEVRADVLRDYVTDNYVRSHIRLHVTPKPNKELEIEPWFHFLYREGNTIVVSIDADMVFDVYRELVAEDKIESY